MYQANADKTKNEICTLGVPTLEYQHYYKNNKYSLPSKVDKKTENW